MPKKLKLNGSMASYDGDLSLPLGLALGSQIFPSGCEGKLGVALESLQGAESLSHVQVCDLMDCSPPGSSVHGIF